MSTTLPSAPDTVPAPGTCHVWWARVDDVAPEHGELLDGADTARLARLARPDDRARSTVAWAVARLVLAAAAGGSPADLRFDRTCAVCGGPHGKPRLVGTPDLQFSIAHTAGWAAVAVGRDAPVGVDVEQVGPWAESDLDDVARLALAPVERAVLAGRPAEERAVAFTTYWTRKEAVVKAVGTGLSTPPAELVVSPPSAPPRVLRWSGTSGMAPGRTPLLSALEAPAGVVGAVAVLSAGPLRVVERDAGPLLRGYSSRRLSSVTTRSQRWP